MSELEHWKREILVVERDVFSVIWQYLGIITPEGARNSGQNSTVIFFAYSRSIFNSLFQKHSINSLFGVLRLDFLDKMTRLFLFLLSSLGVAVANPLTSDTFSKQFNRRQLPQCAGYGSVCRIDFTNHVNGSQGEFVSRCPRGVYQWLTLECCHSIPKMETFALVR